MIDAETTDAEMTDSDLRSLCNEAWTKFFNDEAHGLSYYITKNKITFENEEVTSLFLVCYEQNNLNLTFHIFALYDVEIPLEDIYFIFWKDGIELYLMGYMRKIFQNDY